MLRKKRKGNCCILYDCDPDVYSVDCEVVISYGSYDDRKNKYTINIKSSMLRKLISYCCLCLQNITGDEYKVFRNIDGRWVK